VITTSFAKPSSRTCPQARAVDPSDTEEFPEQTSSRYRVHLCLGPNCSARGSRDLLSVLEAAVQRAGLGDTVEIVASTCRNRCEIGPSMNVYPGPYFYREVTAEVIELIVDQHLAGGTPVEEHLVKFVLPNLPDIF
jgi:(2Fe-2S) ferredoxin